MPSTLVVSNDFPPRIGGIESFVERVCGLLDGDVVVYTSGPPGAVRSDVGRPYAVVRDGDLLLPTPRSARRAVELLRAYGASRVVLGSAAPLGMLAPTLRRAGASTIVGLTHGHEVWWASLPGARSVLRVVGDACDHLTTVSDYTAARIAPALSPAARSRLLRLSPPVDPDLFRPGPDRGRSAVVVAVARFVRQKGLDVLVRAWPGVLAACADLRPAPQLVLVGDGPQAGALRRLVTGLGTADSVTFAGALRAGGVAEQLRAAAVFALPVRTRLRGLNPEGFGLAAIEAAASGLPVLVGDSGGSRETVLDGLSGAVLPSADVEAWTEAIAALLNDPVSAAAAGSQGRAFALDTYGPDRARATIRGALGLP